MDKDEDEDSVMTIDGVEGGYVWISNLIYRILIYYTDNVIKSINEHFIYLRWRNYFCDKTDKERQIGFLLPDHTGFMALMEKYFYQVLNKHFDSGDTRRWVSRESNHRFSLVLEISIITMNLIQ